MRLRRNDIGRSAFFANLAALLGTPPEGTTEKKETAMRRLVMPFSAVSSALAEAGLNATDAPTWLQVLVIAPGVTWFGLIVVLIAASGLSTNQARNDAAHRTLSMLITLEPPEPSPPAEEPPDPTPPDPTPDPPEPAA